MELFVVLSPPLFEVTINEVVDHEVKSSTSVTHGTHRLLCDGRWKRCEVNNIDEVVCYVRGYVRERERTMMSV